jgi:hypothetical protein
MYETNMQLKEIIAIVEGRLLTAGDDYEREVLGASSADLMSDVLSSSQPDGVLITGLCNPQVVRTALVADLRAVIFVRGKLPAQETLALAHQEGMPLISTPLGLYEISGRLYAAGLPSLEDSFNLS